MKSLSSRVAFLEAKSRNKSNLLVPTSETNKLQSIKLFTKKLSPSLSNTQQLSCIFDELYSKLKSFRKHVTSQLKEAFRDDLCREVVKEIKKYFSPWRFLEIMDCSQQSLNQVSYRSYNFVVCMKRFTYTFIFSY